MEKEQEHLDQMQKDLNLNQSQVAQIKALTGQKKLK
jgi:Spy/CpxP family protein refolding chaperone